jgi:hypothetical protein
MSHLSALASRSRVRARLVAGTVALVFALPSAAQAQGIPTYDANSVRATWARMAADWLAGYQTMSKWRDQLDQKVSHGYRMMSDLDQQRRMAEQARYGELSGFGRDLVDMSNMQNSDAYVSADKLVRDARHTLQGLPQEYGFPSSITDITGETKHFSILFTAAKDANSSISEILGKTLTEARNNPAARKAMEALRPAYAAQADAAVKLGTWAADIDGRLKKINEAVALIDATEKLTEKVSSGRARQISAQVDAAQLRISVDHMAAQVYALQLKSQHLAAEVEGSTSRTQVITVAGMRGF